MHIEVSASTFQTEIIERSKSVPVIVDFWAPWCGPCRTLGPVLDRLAAAGVGKWVLAKVNTDENQGLAQRYQIQGIPAVKAFVNGVVVDEFVGAKSEPQVKLWLSKVVPDEATVLAQRALHAEQAGDVATAAMLFDDALRTNAQQPDALLHAANTAIRKADVAGARALLAQLRPEDRNPRISQLARLSFRLAAGANAAQLPEQSPSIESAFNFAISKAAAEEWAEALALFLDVVRRDRSFGGDAGRKAMLDVFDALGPEAALTVEYRKKLSMELFK